MQSYGFGSRMTIGQFTTKPDASNGAPRTSEHAMTRKTLRGADVGLAQILAIRHCASGPLRKIHVPQRAVTT